MARVLIFAIIATLEVCRASDSEFIYFKYRNSVNANVTMQKIANDIAEELEKITEIRQLMHSWYRIFVRRDKVEFMLRQSSNIFKRFLVDALSSYVEEASDDRSLNVDLTMSLNRTHLVKSTELLNLLNYGHNRTKVFRSTCDTQKSLQQTFVEFYQTNLSNGTRSYFTLAISYDDFDDDQTEYFRPFELKKDSAMRLIMSELLAQVSRDVWRCDPSVHQKGVTYDYIESLRSIAIANTRMTMGALHSQDCGNYRNLNSSVSNHVAKVSARYGLNYSHVHDHLQIFDCKNVETTTSICLTARSEDDRIIERAERCGGKRLVLLNRNHHCVCTYANYDNRQAYVNVAPIMSDTDRNYVVIGARLRKEVDDADSMLILNVEIQQARLEENGRVDLSTAEWKRNDDYVINGLFYHSHAFNTLDLEGQGDEVLVGLQFSETRDKAIYLKPLLRKFDFDTGVLTSEARIHEDGGGCNRTLSLKNADVPTLARAPSLPEPGCVKVTFGPSGFERDRGQTTVPYVDVQEVTATTPLSGASLYYKGSKGYGGFVALKLRTYNMAEHL